MSPATFFYSIFYNDFNLLPTELEFLRIHILLCILQTWYIKIILLFLFQPLSSTHPLKRIRIVICSTSIQSIGFSVFLSKRRLQQWKRMQYSCEYSPWRKCNVLLAVFSREYFVISGFQIDNFIFQSGLNFLFDNQEYYQAFTPISKGQLISKTTLHGFLQKNNDILHIFCPSL